MQGVARHAGSLLLTLTALSATTTTAQAQTATVLDKTARYRVAGETVVLEWNADAIIFRPHRDLHPAERDALLDEITFDHELPGLPEALPGSLYLASTDEGRTETVLAALSSHPGIEFASSTFRYGKRLVVPTGAVLVGFEPDAPIAHRDDLCEMMHLTPTRTIEGLGVHRLESRDAAGRDPFALLPSLEGNPGVRFAEPELMWRATSSVNDPLLPEAWHLDNVGSNEGTNDADMDVAEAWELTRGSADIVVAIIDEGVDMDHEDLAANIVGGIDVTDQAATPPEGVPGNAGQNDAHGTACAGIVAGIADNGTGSAGVAPSTSILSVRIGRGGNGGWTTNSWAATGIQRAWQAGADILSNSWGGGTPSSAIDSAILAAVQQGRNGLGAVVLFAAGNENGAIDYPAYLPQTIAVGASSPCDERKSPTSCDGETWWGSNFGSTLDVVAPGVKIRTTDIMGAGGYRSGHYTSSMNGTSAATPAAAGVVALMLAKNPLLTQGEVRSILRSTADDLVGTSSEDIPGFDVFMGYGRVNAFRAVVAVAPPNPPTVTAIDPASGPLAGGNEITIYGDQFLGECSVTVDGIEADCEPFDRNTITVTIPAGVKLGGVDVTVTNLVGTVTAPASYVYEANPTAVTFDGTPNGGRNVTLITTGPARAYYAIAVDTNPGSYQRKGFTFCFEGPGSEGFQAVKLFRDGSRLSDSGTGEITFRVPDLPIFSSLYFHAATWSHGDLEISSCMTMTVF